MSQPTTLPPRQIPAHLEPYFSLNGTIPVLYRYENGTNTVPRVYDKETIEKFLSSIARRKTFYYGKTDIWLYEALEKFPIRDSQVAIMGSGAPLYESICLYYGGKPVTVEYNPIETRDERLTVMPVRDYLKKENIFDAAFSISSFEHDGLGRYGDPLNPNGDLEAMEQMRKAIVPGGLLFLAVETGMDQLIWNLHRVYGPIRLPMLLQGWEVVDVFGKQECRFKRVWKNHAQPVFVLRNSNRPGLGSWLTDQLKNPRGRWF